MAKSQRPVGMDKLSSSDCGKEESTVMICRWQLQNWSLNFALNIAVLHPIEHNLHALKKEG